MFPVYAKRIFQIEIIRMNRKFFYRNITEKDIFKIKHWLNLPYISEWIHGDGLQSTLNGIDRCVKGIEHPNRYWLASEDKEDFAFLIAGVVDQKEDIFKSISFEGDKAVSLDIFICNEIFLGKGLGHYLICDFLLRNFPDASDFVIDPEKTNKRAIHVYKKVGFRKKTEFIASWYPVPHLMMHVTRKKLYTQFKNSN